MDSKRTRKDNNRTPSLYGSWKITKFYKHVNIKQSYAFCDFISSLWQSLFGWEADLLYV